MLGHQDFNGYINDTTYLEAYQNSRLQQNTIGVGNSLDEGDLQVSNNGHQEEGLPANVMGNLAHILDSLNPTDQHWSTITPQHMAKASQ